MITLRGTGFNANETRRYCQQTVSGIIQNAIKPCRDT